MSEACDNCREQYTGEALACHLNALLTHTRPIMSCIPLVVTVFSKPEKLEANYRLKLGYLKQHGYSKTCVKTKHTSLGMDVVICWVWSLNLYHEA